MQDAADVKQIRQGRYKAKVRMQGRLYFREKVKAGNAKKSAGRLSDTTLNNKLSDPGIVARHFRKQVKNSQKRR